MLVRSSAVYVCAIEVKYSSISIMSIFEGGLCPEMVSPDLLASIIFKDFVNTACIADCALFTSSKMQVFLFEFSLLFFSLPVQCLM